MDNELLVIKGNAIKAALAAIRAGDNVHFVARDIENACPISNIGSGPEIMAGIIGLGSNEIMVAFVDNDYISIKNAGDSYGQCGLSVWASRHAPNIRTTGSAAFQDWAMYLMSCGFTPYYNEKPAWGEGIDVASKRYEFNAEDNMKEPQVWEVNVAAVGLTAIDGLKLHCVVAGNPETYTLLWANDKHEIPWVKVDEDYVPLACMGLATEKPKIVEAMVQLQEALLPKSYRIDAVEF